MADVYGQLEEFGEDDPEFELQPPERFTMHPLPDTAAHPVNCRSLVTPGGAAMPGCLSYLSTLVSPLESKLLRAKENFSHKAEDLKYRLALVMWQAEDNTHQNARLKQKQERMETQTAQLKRQQSAMSEEVNSRISQMEKQNSALSDGLDEFSSSLEKSASGFESVEQRTQALEEQAIHTALTAQNMAGDIEQLTTRMDCVAAQVTKAEDGATAASEKYEQMQLLLNNRQNMDRSREETEISSLRFRLESVEKKLQDLGTKSSPPKPTRSISN